MKTFPIIHISTMTGKLEDFHAISTNTRTNPYCIKQNASGDADNICTKCYSHKMLSSYRKNMEPALERNSVALSTSIIDMASLPVINASMFRFDAHGELINDIHLQNLCNIAIKNPKTAFALWTKRNDIISKFFAGNAKPDNLILIYSNPKIGTIMAKPPKHFDRTFNNVLEHEHKEKQNCTGQKCKDCQLCYTIGNGVDTIVEMVKKY